MEFRVIWTDTNGMSYAVRKVNMTFVTYLVCVEDLHGDVPGIEDFVVWEQVWQDGKKEIREIGK